MRGYTDRPRAQLDRFPSAGSSHFVYALADRGARLLIECDGIMWSTFFTFASSSLHKLIVSPRLRDRCLK
jgi:hypothetical protein